MSSVLVMLALLEHLKLDGDLHQFVLGLVQLDLQLLDFVIMGGVEGLSGCLWHPASLATCPLAPPPMGGNLHTSLKA